MKEPNSAGPRCDLHEFRPLDPVQARLDGQHLGGKALLGPVPDADDKEHLERDGDRREQRLDPGSSVRDIVLDPERLLVPEEKRQFSDLPAQSFDLGVDRQRIDIEGDTDALGGGRQDRQKHSGTRGPGQGTHHEEAMIAPVEHEHILPAPRGPE